MDKKRLRLKFERYRYEPGSVKIAQYAAGLNPNSACSSAGLDESNLKRKFANLI